MACSLEMRVPFLDNEVVDVVEKIPVEYKIRNRDNKHILKKVALKYLPREIVYRPKRGFNMPILKWLSEDLQEILRRKFIEQPHPVHIFLSKEAIEHLLNKYKFKQEHDHRKGIVLIHFATFLEVFEGYMQNYL
jgi:asparagine synthase (glutamine-hydrolysing)